MIQPVLRHYPKDITRQYRQAFSAAHRARSALQRMLVAAAATGMYASMPITDTSGTTLQTLLPPGQCRYLHPWWSYRRCAFADGTTFRLRAMASFHHDTDISQRQRQRLMSVTPDWGSDAKLRRGKRAGLRFFRNANVKFCLAR